ncbi:MAG: hypothetical protein ACLSVD_06190 [Eggerthellaceae bacterium]
MVEPIAMPDDRRPWRPRGSCGSGVITWLVSATFTLARWRT